MLMFFLQILKFKAVILIFLMCQNSLALKEKNISTDNIEIIDVPKEKDETERSFQQKDGKTQDLRYVTIL